MKKKRSKNFGSRLRNISKDQRGQVLPITALMMLGLLGMAALVTDAGRASYDYRELQAATDAAALAGATGLPSSTTAIANAANYSAQKGDENSTTNLSGVSMVSGYPVVKCLQTMQNQGVACTGSPAVNAIQVKEQVAVPMYFAGVLGYRSITLTASATAVARGANPTPANVAIIMDATLSQDSWDSDCNATEMQCSLSGVQVLLKELYPCNTNTAACTISNGVAQNSVDRVALFTFPAVSIGTAGIDSGCTTAIPNNGYYYYSSSFGAYSMMPQTAWSGVPTALAYTFPTAGASTYAPSGASNPTYQLTQFLSDYKTSDSATSLNSASAIVKAVGGKSGCGAMAPPNYDGDFGTYYAGVIYAAQSALTAEKAAYPGSQNVIILLSDGNATAPQTNGSYTVMPSPATSNGLYPSWNGECGQAVTAAKAATAAGTTVYTVAYGSEPSGCGSDVNAGSYPNITPCQTMQDMASNAQNFYSDYNQSGSNSTCYATVQSATKLNDIFAAIAADLTTARLVPDSTT